MSANQNHAPILILTGANRNPASNDVFANEEAFPPLTKSLIDLTDAHFTGYSAAAARPEVAIDRISAEPRPQKLKEMKFNDQEHERRVKFDRARRQFGVNITIADVQDEYPFDISNWTKHRVFTEPATKSTRIHAIKKYIASGTGFNIDDIIVDNIYCTVDDNKVIAWVTSNERMVNELFRGAAIIKKENFSMFSSIPQGAKERKREVEKLLKSFREHDRSLKYQIRNGTRDIKLMIKFQEENDFQYWKEIDIEQIDAFETIPDMELSTPNPDDNREELNETPPKDMNEWTHNQKKNKQKRKNMSPVQAERKRHRAEFTPLIMVRKLKEYLYGNRTSILDNQ